MLTRRLLPLLLLATTLPGCVVAGTLLHRFSGPPEVDAKYDPQKRPTLVLVENYQDQDASALDGDTVARQVGDALHEHLELTVIDPDKVTPIRTEHPADFRQMTLADIGAAVGAEQVVYVNLVESETTADPTGAAVTAKAVARVRVIDCKTKATLWPAGQPQGFQLSAKRDYDRVDSPQGSAMRSQLLSDLSDGIGHLFYKWKPDTEKEDTPGT